MVADGTSDVRQLIRGIVRLLAQRHTELPIGAEEWLQKQKHAGAVERLHADVSSLGPNQFVQFEFSLHARAWAIHQDDLAEQVCYEWRTLGEDIVRARWTGRWRVGEIDYEEWVAGGGAEKV